VATARTRLEGAAAEIAKERAIGLAEVDAERGKLSQEIEAMHMHKEAQQGHVKLNIGGYRFETPVQTLRRVPHTFFDAYFSGRYAQDVCRDGSIFIDRDGEHFGHVLKYMRSGTISVAEPGARPSASLLRALKREFGFYCIEVHSGAKKAIDIPTQIAYVVGGSGAHGLLASMEQYNASSGQWSGAAAMGSVRKGFGACALAGEVYLAGGGNDGGTCVSSVEKYSPSTDTWSPVPPLPTILTYHAAVSVDFNMYVLGGSTDTAMSDSVFIFDSVQGIWREGEPLPEPRCGLSACANGVNIYIFGGLNEIGQAQVSSFKFDTEANAWRTLPPTPQESAFTSASVLDDQVYIVGAGASNRAVFRFDLASEVWSTLTSTLQERRGCTSFVIGGCLYAAGGLGESLSVERYDVANNVWTAVADMSEGRQFACAVTIESVEPAQEQNLFDLLIAKDSAQHP
jgi:hypothetical protein